LGGFGRCFPCSPFGQSMEIVLYLPTYLNLPVVFLLSPFSVGKCKSSLVETNPGNQIPATIRFAVPANRWSSSYPPLYMDQSYSDSNPPMRSWRKPEDFTSYCGVVDLGSHVVCKDLLASLLSSYPDQGCKDPVIENVLSFNLYDISKQSNFLYLLKSNYIVMNYNLKTKIKYTFIIVCCVFCWYL